METASLATPSGLPGVLRPETSTSSEQAPCSSFCENDATRNNDLSNTGGLLHTYLGRTSEDYQALVDVVLVTSEDRLPAHSQLLALEAGVVAKTLITLKTPPSRQDPLVFDEPILRNSSPAAVLRFLDMVYYPQSAPSGLEQALAVFKIADFLDAPRLVARLHEYMKVQGPVQLVVNGLQSPVKWLLEAEHPGLESFRDVCINYIAQHFGSLANDPLLQQLTANSLVRLLHAVYIQTPSPPQPQPATQQQIRPRPVIPRALLPPTPQHHWQFAPIADPYGPHGCGF